MAARVALVHSDWFARHDTGADHPECADRLNWILDGLRESGLVDGLARLDFEPAQIADLELVHEPAYVDLMRRVCEDGFSFIGSTDTRICRMSYEAARWAAGGVIAACDAVLDGRADRAFCAVRPPGHHAHRDRAGGFCLFNNIAIAAEHLIRRRHLDRVAIVDFDVHHGDGTQSIFEQRADVLYISLHQHPETLHPGTGFESERGSGAGEGFTLNVPLRPLSGETDYLAAIDRHVEPALRAFGPRFLLVSAGFDAARAERISRMCLESESFGRITRTLVRIADDLCGGRIVSALEGGYELPTLARSVAEHVRALGASGALTDGR